MNHGMGEAPKRCHRSSKEPAVFGPDRLHLLRYWLRFFLLHLRKFGLWCLEYGGSNMILSRNGWPMFMTVAVMIKNGTLGYAVLIYSDIST